MVLWLIVGTLCALAAICAALRYNQLAFSWLLAATGTLFWRAGFWLTGEDASGLQVTCSMLLVFATIGCYGLAVALFPGGFKRSPLKVKQPLE